VGKVQLRFVGRDGLGCGCFGGDHLFLSAVPEEWEYWGGYYTDVVGKYVSVGFSFFQWLCFFFLMNVGYVLFRVPFTTADGLGTPLIKLVKGQTFGYVLSLCFFSLLAGVLIGFFFFCADPRLGIKLS